MTIALSIFGSLLSRFFPNTNKLQKNSSFESRVSDDEAWTLVTEGGRYPEVWETYRSKGLIEAIRERDNLAEFDCRLARISSPGSSGDRDNIQQEQASESVTITARQTTTIAYPSSDLLDELDLARVKGMVSYFEEMVGKIMHYHQDHNASKDEARIICKYYQQTAELINQVETKADLKQVIKFIENLKNKVSRYQHDNYKYRWSTGLDKMIVKLKNI